MPALNASDRLQAGKAAAREGRFEEALAQFIWFHEHALEEDGALSAVRRSFALGHWIELAAQYPPALAAFRARRDDALARLSGGELDRDLFRDAEAMSERLGEDERTAELFDVLDARHPEFARQCGSAAVPMLTRVKRFSLAARYMPEPLPEILSLADKLVRDIARIDVRPRTKAPVYRVRVTIFVREVLRFEEILRETGRAEAATQLRTQALEALKPIYLRHSVVERLASEV